MSTRAPSIITRLDIKFFETALCAESDPESFFPEKGLKHSTANANRAKAICFSCVNRKECLDWALLIDDRWAIMGGLTPRARRSLRESHKKTINAGIKAGLSLIEIADKNGYTLAYFTKLQNERLYSNGYIPLKRRSRDGKDD